MYASSVIRLKVRQAYSIDRRHFETLAFCCLPLSIARRGEDRTLRGWMRRFYPKRLCLMMMPSKVCSEGSSHLSMNLSKQLLTGLELCALPNKQCHNDIYFVVAKYGEIRFMEI